MQKKKKRAYHFSIFFLWMVKSHFLKFFYERVSEREREMWKVIEAVKEAESEGKRKKEKQIAGR